MSINVSKVFRQNYGFIIALIAFSSIVEIIAIEYEIGIPIFNQSTSRIILNLSYAFLCSTIFYFFIEILPNYKKNNFNKKQYYDFLFLTIQLIKVHLDDLGHESEFENGATTFISTFKSEEKIKKFDNLIDFTKNQIPNIMKFSTYIDADTESDIHKLITYSSGIIFVVEGEEDKNYYEYTYKLYQIIKSIYFKEEKEIKKRFSNRLQLFENWNNKQVD